MAPTDDEILAAVAREATWMEELTGRLVAARTTLGAEEPGQAIMREALRDSGLEPQAVPLDARPAAPVHLQSVVEGGINRPRGAGARAGRRRGRRAPDQPQRRRDQRRRLAVDGVRVTGASAPLQASTATTDARQFALYAGIPAVSFGPLAADIHGVDERVHVPSILTTAQALALLVRDWCGLEDGAEPS